MEEQEFMELFTGVEIPEAQKDVLKTAFGKVSEKITAAHSGVTNSTLTGVDAFVAQKFGIQKNQGEKSGDYYARAFDSLNTSNAAKIAEFEAKITELTAQGGNKKAIEEMTAQMDKLKAEYEGKINEAQSQVNALNFDRAWDKTTSTLKFQPLAETILQPFIDRVKDEVKAAKFVTVDGKELVASENGIPIVTDGKFVTKEEFILSKLKPIILDESVKGTGSKTDGGTEIKLPNVTVTGNSQTEALENLKRELREKGIKDFEYNKALKALIESETYKKLKLV